MRIAQKLVDEMTTRRTVLAAGGLVFRNNGRLELAVVRLRKYPHWVLPKGKLKANEKCRGAAKREVFEETGHRVSVQEFVGTLAYESSGRQDRSILADGSTTRGDARPIFGRS
jgi:8-oxo-dGTP pyrophosphatase MutT (NUDIX family)